MLFAADVGDSLDPNLTDVGASSGLPGSNLTPNPISSRKISVDKIEVTWGRYIVTSSNVRSFTTSTIDPLGIEVSPMKNGFGKIVGGNLVEDSIKDNLRMRDNSFPAYFDNAPAGSVVHYYLGHPTERVKPALWIDVNHAVRIDAKPVAPRTYTIAVHVIAYTPPGGTQQTTGIAVTDVDAILSQVNSIWSQVGVKFALPTAGGRFMDQNTASIDRFDMIDGDLGTEADDLTAEHQTPLLDIYFVNSIRNPEAGGSYIPIEGTTRFPGMGGKPGAIVAVRSAVGTGTLNPKKPNYSLARTLAHELGHYLMKVGNSAHTNQPRWNVMVAGEESSDKKRDLTETQAGAIKVAPSAPDQ